MAHNPSADEGLVEAMGKAVWESWSSRRWDSIGKHVRADMMKDMAIALAAARSHGGM